MPKVMAAFNKTTQHQQLVDTDTPPPTTISTTFVFTQDLRNFLLLMNCAIGLVGCASNSINILVFYRQGFKESINVSLFSLSISDFLICFIGIFAAGVETSWANAVLERYDLHKDITYMTVNFPRVYLTVMTPMLTAYITFERCLCVALPLKVKSIITPKRVLIVVLTMLLLCIANSVPNAISHQLRWMYYPELNKTLYGIYRPLKYESLNDFHIVINLILIVFVLQTIIIVCSVILIKHLLSTATWRQTAVTSSASDKNDNSRKSKRVVKMVVVLSGIFIICYLPGSIAEVVSIVFPDFRVGGRQVDLYHLVWFIIIDLIALNSATTILVYYGYSSVYKSAFNELFGIKIKG